MKEPNTELNASWLNGKYPEIDTEINTQIPYIAIGDFFAQGEEAQTIIDEILSYWNSQDLTQEEAVKKWINNYL